MKGEHDLVCRQGASIRGLHRAPFVISSLLVVLKLHDSHHLIGNSLVVVEDHFR
jgi:hypothetical protein